MHIEIENLSVIKNNSIFNISDKNIILNDLTINFELNQFHLIIGESGAGKTTFLKCLFSIEEISSGNILFPKNERENCNYKMQMLFQYNGELLNPFRTVKSMLHDTFTGLRISKNEMHDVIIEQLKDFNLSQSILEKKGFQLSGGEHQRIALIRLLLTNPDILLLDEPFASQDFESNIIIANKLIELSKKGNMTIFCVSHIITNIIANVDSITVLEKGRIIESGDRETILSHPKNKSTKLLLEGYKKSGIK